MSERKEKINLAKIVSSDDFLRELDRAAVLSSKGKIESGFVVYSEEALLEPRVNRAVKGKKESISGEMTPILESEKRPKPNTGAYISYLWLLFNRNAFSSSKNPPASISG